MPSSKVDFFVTHTCAVGPNYSNAYYRTRQVENVLERIIANILLLATYLYENRKWDSDKKTVYLAPTILFHQVKELVGWVNNSNADFVVLGGDFNTSPTDDVVHHFRV